MLRATIRCPERSYQPPDLTAGGQGPGGRARTVPPTPPKVKSGDGSRHFHQPAARRPHVATRAQRSPRAQGQGSAAQLPASGGRTRQT